MAKSPRNKRQRAPRKPAAQGARGAGGALWIYGRHAVEAALRNPARVFQRLLITREADQALDFTPPGAVPAAETVSPSEIATLLPDGAVHQGIAGLVQPLATPMLDEFLATLEKGDSATIVILDQVTDPRNTGAILRSAAAMGAAAVIVPERRSPHESAVLAKAASGALERVHLIRVANVSRALEALKHAGFWCVGLDAQAPRPLAEADLTGRIALVLGSEGRGLRRLVAENCDFLAALPMAAAMESLNVSAAAAIALYEATRQRRF